MERKLGEKKARTGFEPAIFGFTIAVTLATALTAYETDALPLGHRALYPSARGI